MIKNRTAEVTAALILVAPFVLIYAVLFIYPTIQMVAMSFTNAPLIGEGEWVGLKNYAKMFADRKFQTSVINTFYFVLLTVIPNTLIGLAIAMMVNRLKGWQQSLILALFFLPYILPVSVVYRIWNWMFDLQFGVMQYPIEFFTGQRIPVFRTPALFLPAVAFVTIWWTCGFNILLFLAGLRAISPEMYEAASLDNAGRWKQFTRITWPLIWPVTALVLTIQLILQLKIFDQVYLFVQGGRADPSMVMVQYIYVTAFQKSQGGYGATIAVALFVIIIAMSVLQFTVLRARGEK
ncbi:carbohydrate ABC transporter permease [Paradevosia shaoguanensis]|uniref:Sugar ABC transporter permease n=1 Tax=Paradevosia shaoguanensis TaxID=1335043 RepID=A0AA41QKK0_9HYPH|nr:sugar ABC transporter permease [Paradevosia shaoguanensis]KFL28225.1 sugar ABC transporter permease [Devosia sp. 17-2-E-8]MCF1741836.1 sugar ABC transporter permease [Paradevosia shaoguanensis]MCI0126319.1 sugar ABC transporter permease [Paradevosia shaoguanensis]CDP50034.1 Glycerol-3-phosphate ABC transporter, permease pro tein UgpA [Devosia sp. DBB001]